MARRGRVRRATDASRGRAAPPREPSLGPVLDFMRLLWAVEHGLGRISRRMERTLGLTEPQRLVVRLAGKKPGVSAGELARMLHVHPSTLTDVLRRLRDRGILLRTRDPRDARRELYHLSRRGLELDAVRRGTGEERVRAALAEVPAKDVAAAERVLAKLADVLAQD